MVTQRAYLERLYKLLALLQPDIVLIDFKNIYELGTLWEGF